MVHDCRYIIGSPAKVGPLGVTEIIRFFFQNEEWLSHGVRGIADIQITLGQTGVNQTQAVAEGRADVGNCPFILPFLLSKGAGPYAALGAEKGAELAANLRVLYPYSFGAYTLYAYDTAGVGGWDDLAGKTILDGPPRGAATAEARSLIQVVTGLKPDEDYKPIESDWPQMVTTITEGSSDVALLPEFIPSDRPLQALSAGQDPRQPLSQSGED